MTSEKQAQKFLLMTRHYRDVGSTSDWFEANQISQLESLPRSGLRHQYGISALVFQALFRGETTGGVTKCWLFSQVKIKTAHYNNFHLIYTLESLILEV